MTIQSSIYMWIDVFELTLLQHDFNSFQDCQKIYEFVTSTSTQIQKLGWKRDYSLQNRLHIDWSTCNNFMSFKRSDGEASVL